MQTGSVAIASTADLHTSYSVVSFKRREGWACLWSERLLLQVEDHASSVSALKALLPTRVSCKVPVLYRVCSTDCVTQWVLCNVCDLQILWTTRCHLRMLSGQLLQRKSLWQGNRVNFFNGENFRPFLLLQLDKQDSDKTQIALGEDVEDQSQRGLCSGDS